MANPQRSLGAYTDLAQLASYRLAASRVQLTPQQRARHRQNGQWISQRRGRGMEFEDVRQYQSGDDIRSIDWRVTARTGQAHTRQYREEREKPLLIVLDQRSSLFFGSRLAMKSVLAADLAAMLAWAGHGRGDRVGGLVIGNHHHQDIRPGQQRKSVMRLLQCISDYNQLLDASPCHTGQGWHDILAELQRISRPGSQLFLISDFHDLDEKASAILHRLAKSCDITAIVIDDPLESELPAAGRYRAFNGRQQLVFDSNPANRQRYRNAYAARRDALQQFFNRLRIPLVHASTSDEPLTLLQQLAGAIR